MGIDPLEMEYKELHGSPEDQKAAKRIRPLLKRHHLLLSTLLLGNAMCFEALPIFMDALVPSWVAILLATTVILVFGEVLPQALCTGPRQIQIAAGVAPIVNFFLYLFLPVTYFIAKGLDMVLGVHGTKRYNKKLLMGIVGLHVMNEKERSQQHAEGVEMKEHGHDDHGHGPHEGLTGDEMKIIQSTIELRDIPVEEIMVPLESVFMLDYNDTVNNNLLYKIFKRKFSRIPVYDSDVQKIVGVLPAKELVTASEYIGSAIGQAFRLSKTLFVSRDQNLLELLTIFQMNSTQIAFVTAHKVRQSKPNIFHSVGLHDADIEREERQELRRPGHRHHEGPVRSPGEARAQGRRRAPLFSGRLLSRSRATTDTSRSEDWCLGARPKPAPASLITKNSCRTKSKEPQTP